MKNKRFLKGALAGLVLVVGVSSGLAFAAHPFTDVPAGQFYSDAVDWAYNNGVTTGTSATTFEPTRNVTRGENITFTWRYDDLIVQPALTGLDADVLAALLETTTIPSGTMLTGNDSWDHTIVADNQDWFTEIHFPGRAPKKLTSADVNFAPNALAADGDATCTGTASAPTAPSGKVCIYLSTSSGVDSLAGYLALVTGFEDRGFSVQGFSNGAQGNDEYARFSWAYTAP